MIYYSSDPFRLFEIPTRQKQDEFEQTFLELLGQWHQYKAWKTASKHGGYPNTGNQQSAVRLDDVIFKLAQPGISASDDVKNFFHDLTDKFKEKKLLRNARNFDNSIYEGHSNYFEFTDDGYEWFKNGSEPALSESTKEYISKIQESMEPNSVTDLKSGLDYLEEGHLAFFELNKPLLRCSSFMIGAASEFLVSKIYSELQVAYTISPGGAETSASKKLNELTSFLAVNGNVNRISSKASDSNKARIEIKEFHGILTRIGNVIRMDRNDVGHPTNHHFTENEVRSFFGELRHLYQKGSYLYFWSSIP